MSIDSLSAKEDIDGRSETDLSIQMPWWLQMGIAQQILRFKCQVGKKWCPEGDYIPFK